VSHLPALYEIANQFKSLALLADTDDLPEEVLRDTLEGLEGTLELKATNIAMFILGLEAEAKMIDEAAEAMKARAERRRRRAEGIRNYVLFQLGQAGITKVNCPEFTISVRKNPDAVQIDDPERVPAEYMVQPPAPPPRIDKNAIKADLKAGKSVAGCWLRSGERLEIKA
jgi:hypothetical protein